MASETATKSLEELEQEYDPEMRFRPVINPADYVVKGMLVALAGFHYVSAGMGTLPEHWHKGIHLSFVLGLIFIVFGYSRKAADAPPRSAWWRPFNVHASDWLLFAAAVACSIYLPTQLENLVYRLGNPNPVDLVAGTVMVALVLEAARRSMGPVLPIIVCVFILYALFGRHAPGPLIHPGTSWRLFIDHIYMTTEGIYGIPVGVVSSYVFLFVLFGVIATRIGLGALFIGVSQCLAGRYAGGPAKVSVVSSALFGTISGSSIANTVTTGSLTIPAMKRTGYQPHFAAATEAAASSGGQITPPIMGASAFVMMEFLEAPYTTILLAALVPAAMHYLGVMVIVHLEAKRLGLRGMTKEELPELRRLLRDYWPTLIPLVILVGLIAAGYTPFLAAFYGITACVVVGFVNPNNRLTVRDLLDCTQLGSKYALAVGAAAAAVGIIVGVVTLTGAPFRISFMVTEAAVSTSESILAVLDFLPFELVSLETLTLFFSLVFIAVCCIAMSSGVPTTALYIILAAIAAPALVQLGIPAIAAHFFVLYYGVLADLTPPVCTSAYAAAGIAGANPFKTGMTAFRLGNAKAMVPFVFVYSPVMLIVVDGYFNWPDFLAVTLTCAIGVGLMGAALTGFLLEKLPGWTRWAIASGAVLLVAPGMQSNLIGTAIVVPVLCAHVIAWRRTKQSHAGQVPRAAS